MTRTPIFVGFIGAVAAANYATAHYGLIPVGFGLTATAGTYFAGATFVLRDALQDTAGRLAVLLAILAGAALSTALSPAQLALASGVAFLLAETADWAIYTPLRARGYIRAAIGSNVIGAIVDTYVFLTLAGFPITRDVFAGQILGKLAVTALVLLAVLLARVLLRQPSRV